MKTMCTVYCCVILWSPHIVDYCRQWCHTGCTSAHHADWMRSRWRPRSTARPSTHTLPTRAQPTFMALQLLCSRCSSITLRLSLVVALWQPSRHASCVIGCLISNMPTTLQLRCHLWTYISFRKEVSSWHSKCPRLWTSSKLWILHSGRFYAICMILLFSWELTYWWHVFVIVEVNWQLSCARTSRWQCFRCHWISVVLCASFNIHLLRK